MKLGGERRAQVSDEGEKEGKMEEGRGTIETIS